MKLICSQTSPFARKCRIQLRIQGLTSLVKECASDPFSDTSLRATNPLGKVPALIDGELTLFDSPLICEYLDQVATQNDVLSLFQRDNANYFLIQKVHAQADGLLDAAVATVMEQRRDTEHSELWLSRWYDSVKSAVETIELEHAGSKESPTIATIALVSALGYLDFRLADFNWRNWNNSLAKWFDQFTEETWFTETTPG